MADILVVDDEEKICFAFSRFIKELGHIPHVASNSISGMDLVIKIKPQIVFLDIRLPGESGLSMLEKIKMESPGTIAVIMTAFGTMDTAIDAVKQGAYEYLTKPLDLDLVEELINRIMRPRQAAPVDQLFDQEDTPDDYTLIGKTDAISDIYKMIGLLTTNDVPVLIEGESGTGKELVARAIHNKSARSQAPFVAINCGAMPENLLETELFGHEKGAFTGAERKKIGKFEFAGRGTLFLDEIGDLKLPLQIKLLRVLQEKSFVRVGGLENLPVAARIISATNKNLLEEMKTGNFRSDLYYRLQLITLKIPPLRERKEDLPVLCHHFIKKANKEMNKKIKGIEKAALKILENHNWPGNVRELENIIKRAMIISRGETIGPYGIEIAENDYTGLNDNLSLEAISEQVRQWFSKRLDLFPEDQPLYPAIINLVEKTLIEEALKKSENNQVKASDILGMNRTTLRNKIKDYRL